MPRALIAPRHPAPHVVDRPRRFVVEVALPLLCVGSVLVAAVDDNGACAEVRLERVHALVRRVAVRRAKHHRWFPGSGTPRRSSPSGGLFSLIRCSWIAAQARPCSCRLRRFGVVPSWGLYFPSATRRHTLSLTYSGRSRSPLSRARSVVGREHGAHALYTRHPGLCSGQLGMRAVLRPIT